MHIPAMASAPRHASRTPSARVLSRLRGRTPASLRPARACGAMGARMARFCRLGAADVPTPPPPSIRRVLGADSSAVSLVPWRRRIPALAVVAYVVTTAMWIEGGRGPRVWAAAAAAAFVALAAARAQARLARAVGWGLAVALASLGADGRALDACGAVGACTCVIGACVAVARVPASGGIVRAGALRAAPAVVLVCASWAAAVGAAIAPDRTWLAWLGPYAAGWSVGAAATSLLVLVGVVEWTLWRRRLDLGVTERALAMRSLLILGCASALILGLLGPGRVDQLGRLVVALVATSIAAASLASDAVRVARVARRTVTLAIVGGSVALVGASAAQGRAWDAWAATLVTAAVALLVGSAAAVLEAPLRPARGAWLDAFAAAAAQATRAEPDDALRE